MESTVSSGDPLPCGVSRDDDDDDGFSSSVDPKTLPVPVPVDPKLAADPLPCGVSRDYDDDDVSSSVDPETLPVPAAVDPGKVGAKSGQSSPVKTFRLRPKKYLSHDIHLDNGGEIVNPDKIWYEYEELSTDQEFTSWNLSLLEPRGYEFEFGFPIFGFIFGRGEVMVAVNHSKHGFVPNIIALSSHMIATVTGEDTSLLSHLKWKCYQWEQQQGKRIPALKAAELMAEALTSRGDVGLIAGWEYGWDSDYEMGPQLYRVDRTGLIIKGRRLPSGSGVPLAYAFSDVDELIDMKWRVAAHEPNKYFPAFPYDEKYKDWSVWSLNEAAWFAGKVIGEVASDPRYGGAGFISVYHVGPAEWSTVSYGRGVEPFF
ncbi:OLC1v1037317C2 [Oldenlandia corymbosa var. corymbosa]|uniref:OLC1v1037317C2 n=1 Tax=Oldenlandia corymbosa var. corymbosa TaxID=529605 RepID=A0AAV1CYT1_OLDCO|nr:OLC1v1037317C2 [Oldenlandia corymbosa var. corymbosa]